MAKMTFTKAELVAAAEREIISRKRIMGGRYRSNDPTAIRFVDEMKCIAIALRNLPADALYFAPEGEADEMAAGGAR